MKTIYATTTLIGIIFMCTTINVIGDIHNIPSSSILFSITTIAIGIGVLCTFFIRQKTLFKFTCTDLFMVVLTISYLVYHLPLSGIRELGTGSLLFIYWCIRYTGKLNYSLIFYFILVSITLLLITLLFTIYRPNAFQQSIFSYYRSLPESRYLCRSTQPTNEHSYCLAYLFPLSYPLSPNNKNYCICIIHY